MLRYPHPSRFDYWVESGPGAAGFRLVTLLFGPVLGVATV